MKFKSLGIVIFCGCLLLSGTGCRKKADPAVSSAVSSAPIVSSEPEPEIIETKAINPLTGIAEFEHGEQKKRPVAIMINNINIAQAVQCGLDAADIIYETEVEGGITRLMAVYQDVSKAGRIGTVRSCRYVYVDLAKAHNAVYIHCGQDPHFAKPHLAIINDVDLGSNNYGTRISNGLAREHTLYTDGKTLSEGLPKAFDMKNRLKVRPWQKFAAEDVEIKLSGGKAEKVTVPFSNSYVSTFEYNAATGKYTREFFGNTPKDYVTGKPTTVKNVFILHTSIYTYPTDPEHKHRCVELNGGKGYYMTNGTYTPIQWSKGSADAGFVFKKENGKPLKVSAGDSWVCIADASRPVTIQ